MKPVGSCQGKGIFLTSSFEQVASTKEAMVVQEYVPDPLLIDGLKFDLRIYVLVTSVDPLRILIYENGLVRFATVSRDAVQCSRHRPIDSHSYSS